MPAISQVQEGEPNEEKGQEGRQEGPEKREIRTANKIRNYRTPRLHRGVSFLWTGQRTRGRIGSNLGRGFSPFQRAFAQIEKKRQRAGDAHGQQPQNGQPEPPYPKTAPFRTNESQEHHG